MSDENTNFGDAWFEAAKQKDAEIAALRDEVERLRGRIVEIAADSGIEEGKHHLRPCDACAALKARAEAAEKALDTARREAFVEGARWATRARDLRTDAEAEALRWWPEEVKP